MSIYLAREIQVMLLDFGWLQSEASVFADSVSEWEVIRGVLCGTFALSESVAEWR
jgi:hypothetical protein